MKILIVISFLVYGCLAAKGGFKKRVKAMGVDVKEIKKDVKEIADTQGDDTGEIDEKLQFLEDKLVNISNAQHQILRLIEKNLELEESEEDEETASGTWHLGMNINPSDGHTFGYIVGWATGNDIGSAHQALAKDYLSSKVWALSANYIAIVRHQHAIVDAVKVFEFKVGGESLLTRFKRMNPGRQIVTEGGPIQVSIADDADYMEDDPIFSVGGDLAFNWAYSDNGCRIALTGAHLSAANVNDDNTHGLGNDFHINPLTNHPHSHNWKFDISNIQDCPLATCRDVKVQGTDRGPGGHLKSGPVYGNYAIYVSSEADRFPEPGHHLTLEIEVKMS